MAVTATGNAAAAAQKQLLALAQAKGNAEKMMRLLVQTGRLDDQTSPRSALEKATALLRLAGGECQSPPRGAAKPAAKEREPKKSKEDDKQWALVAAKVAQSVIKLYVGAAPAGENAAAACDDLVRALELATLALSISCQFESLVKLGDLVVENMLYQVAKKLGETPECTAKALTVFGVLNLRLWHHHAAMRASSSQKSSGEPSSPFETRADDVIMSPSNPLSLDDLVLLCTFPAPQSCHTLQFTRFLISLVNAGVNILLAAGKNEELLTVATKLKPWISHLSRIPGADPKLAASFSDRLFRVLWKCAGAADSEKTPTSEDASLNMRSVALSLMLKCPTYSNAYFAQQVHRVGMQYEKKHAPISGKQSSVHLNRFYVQAATSFFEQCPQSNSKIASVEWDFINWMEHFSSICENQPETASTYPAIDALTALHHGINHATASQLATDRVVRGCLSTLAGCVVLERRLASVKTSHTEKDTQERYLMDKFHLTLPARDRECIIAALPCDSRQTPNTRWIDTVKLYLGGLEVACDVAKDALGISEVYFNFTLRSVRKITARLFGCVNNAEKCPAPALETILSSIVAAGDLLSLFRKNEVVKLSGAQEDSFMLLEGRVRRFAVSVAAKLSTACSTEAASTWLVKMTENIGLFQQVLDDAMTDTGTSRPSLPSLLSDLQAIARDSYSCATFFYKNKLHDLVVKSLDAAFALTETYFEHVMCNEKMIKEPAQVNSAHNALKADVIASLLAFSSREQGNLTQSRACLGLSILYASNPASVSSFGVIDKYVNGVMEEFGNSEMRGRDESVCGIVESLCSSLCVVWSARGVSKEVTTATILRLVEGFDRFATRLLDRLRVLVEMKDEMSPQDQDSIIKVETCTKLELLIWRCLWKREGSVSAEAKAAMEGVLNSLAKRKVTFASYFLKRDSAHALSGLDAAHHELSQALETLSSAKIGYRIDAGGCYGWRGVIAMEICQMSGYSSRLEDTRSDSEDITQIQALEDIRKCLASWQQVPLEDLQRSSAHLFSANGVAVCLDAVSHALSLMSYLQLEAEARSMLSVIQAKQTDSVGADCATSFPIQLLQAGHLALPSCAIKDLKDSPGKADDRGLSQLWLVDADIGLCLASAGHGDFFQGRLHLSNATATMSEFRATIKIAQDDSQLYCAVAMRELALAMAASEVVFQEGDLSQALREAKSALSICWKVSKRVGIVDQNSARTLLPDEVLAALGKHADHSQKASQLVYFQAIECWSWDILLAAKLILSRIAYLYALENQPFRSSIYYAEAMTLVSGVVPAATRMRPFFEFGQLQVLAERTNHASAVHQLVTLIPGDESVSDASVDASIITQTCEVYLQRGDLMVLEGDEVGAKDCYEKALLILQKMDRRTPAANSVACGCYRRILKVQLRSPWSEENIDHLLQTLKQLRRTVKKCPDLLEYGLATCQLVQASLALLRSSSSKAFLPCTKLVTLMEEALARSDHVGIAYLCQDVRFTLGQVYLMMSESRDQAPTERVRLNWAAALCLSSCNATGLSSPLAAALKSGTDGNNARSPAQAFVSGLQECVIKHIPDNWMTVTLTANELTEFMISILPARQTEPVSFYIGKVKWPELSQEFSDIIEASRVTLFGNSSDSAEEWTSDKRKQWWATRKDLDDRLAALIVKVQNALGFWRALLTFSPSSECLRASEELMMEISSLLYEGSRSLTHRSTWLLSAVIAANSILTDAELLQCIDQVAIEENVSIRQELAENLMKVLRKTVAPAFPSGSVSTTLILHRRLEKFPWEGLDVLCGRAVARMPSIELILQNTVESKLSRAERTTHQTAVEIDPSNVSFVLNPASDLKTTQTNLEPIFRRGETELAWRGVFGEIPEEEWMRDNLVQSDLFVFCGHGSGEKYFHRDKIASLQGQGCAAALLFGCSSGRLEREGVFGPNGAVVSYLQAGSPAVLAMLWDVTDKDVDLMSKDILENWLLVTAGEGSSTDSGVLSVAVQHSRRLCKLQHLNGLAAVCYGLPLRAVIPAQSSAPKRRKLQ